MMTLFLLFQLNILKGCIVIQQHMYWFIQELCQAVEQLNPRLVALSSAMKRLGECPQLEDDVANIRKQHQQFVGKATEKQSTLESLLALWQR